MRCSSASGYYNRMNHRHLDLGNFELMRSVRWARSRSGVTICGLLSNRKGGMRWKYRMKSETLRTAYW